MADRFYYEHDDKKLGPFSGLAMKSFAVAGQILPSDTVWKEGAETGILAGDVKNLFPVVLLVVPEIPPAAVVQIDASPAEKSFVEVDPGDALLLPMYVKPISDAQIIVEETDLPTGMTELAPGSVLLDQIAVSPAPTKIDSRPPENKKRRTVPGKGAVIVGQDGTSVRYKKKCTTCGHEDSFSNSMKIINGMMKAHFFCPKCKKRRNVEIQGRMS